MDEEEKSDSEREIFESEDLEENDYDSKYNSKKQEFPLDPNVIDEEVDPSDAFAKFVQTYHDTSNNDFTGTISKLSKPKTITRFQTSPEFEGPLEKYNRITQELKEFKEELESLQKVDGVSNLVDKMGQEISKLEDNLKPLIISKKYHHFLNPNFPSNPKELHVGNDITENLISNLKKMKSQKKVKEENEVKGMCYELYQSVSKLSKSRTSIASLEKRLACLESAIGTPQLQMFPDIRSTIIYLGKKMEGLDEKRMKEVQAKMSYLTRELKNLEKKKQKLGSSQKSDSQSKILELYGWMSEWDEASHIAPIIKQRLESIKDVVEAGQKSKKKLKDVETKKQENDGGIDKNKALLLKVKTQFTEALEDVKNVCELEQNFEDLARKMQQHFD